MHGKLSDFQASSSPMGRLHCAGIAGTLQPPLAIVAANVNDRPVQESR
jgi:hypothetical protein